MKPHHVAILTVTVLAAAFATGVRAQDANDVVTVELDVFAGRPNPTVELTATELAELVAKASSVCGRVEAGAESKYPRGRLGYRGVTVRRGKRGAAKAPSIELGGKRARLARNETPVVCGDQLSRAKDDLVLSDDTSVLEKHLAALAYAKGAISEGVYQHILAMIDKSP